MGPKKKQQSRLNKTVSLYVTEAYRFEPELSHTPASAHNTAIHTGCLVVSPYSAGCQLKYDSGRPPQPKPEPPIYEGTAKPRATANHRRNDHSILCIRRKVHINGCYWLVVKFNVSILQIFFTSFSWLRRENVSKQSKIDRNF